MNFFRKKEEPEEPEDSIKSKVKMWEQQEDPPPGRASADKKNSLKAAPAKKSLKDKDKDKSSSLPAAVETVKQKKLSNAGIGTGTHSRKESTLSGTHSRKESTVSGTHSRKESFTPSLTRPAGERQRDESSLSSVPGGSGETPVIDYNAATRMTLMTDYEFNKDNYNIMDLFMERKFHSGNNACLNTIKSCSKDQFSKLLPVIALAIAHTPDWALDGACKLVDCVKERTKRDQEAKQAVQCLKSSKLVDSPSFYGEWLAGVEVPAVNGLGKVLQTLLGKPAGTAIDVDYDARLFHPFQTGYRILKVQVDKVFNSNAKPLLLSVQCEDVLVANRRCEGAKMILKVGDDLRQDVSVIHVQCLMNHIWKRNGVKHDSLFVETLLYGCLAFGSDVGVIEFVPNSVSLSQINKVGKFTPAAISRLITTAAGSFIAAYVLGVRDRHHDNIMISKQDGACFHIDFGHILGDETTIDTAGFAITPELQKVICQHSDEDWTVFVDLCVQCWVILRKQARLLIGFVSLLMHPFCPAHTVREFIGERLRLNLDEQVGMDKIRKKVAEAPQNYKTRFKNAMHAIATTIKS